MNTIKTLMATLAIALLVAVAVNAHAASTTVTSEKKFFEPSQQDYDCCSKAVLAQQEVYRKAKASGNYDLAVENALFYTSRAWLHFNKGIKLGTAKGARNSIDQLHKAVEFLNLALKDAEAARDLGYDEEADRIVELADSNIKRFENRAGFLEMQKRKSGVYN